MPIMVWIVNSMFAFLVLFAIVFMLIDYGSDIGCGFCDNFIDYIKKNHELNKEYREERKAERLFLKTNPLCEECRRNGKLRRAVCCNFYNGEINPACEDHYVSTFKRHLEELSEKYIDSQ